MLEKNIWRKFIPYFFLDKQHTSKKMINEMFCSCMQLKGNHKFDTKQVMGLAFFRIKLATGLCLVYFHLVFGPLQTKLVEVLPTASDSFIM